MTKDEALKQLTELAGCRPGGADRADFTKWALVAESIFSRVFSASDLLLHRYRTAIEQYIGGDNDLVRSVGFVIGAFDACKSVLENAAPEEIDVRASDVERSPRRDGQPRQTVRHMIRLFISHASSDRELAARLLKLIRSALSLRPEAIRCTSVDGYGFQGGTDIDEQIRMEVLEAESLVGIISAASLESLYVAFELGARWGANKNLIPVIAPGMSLSELKGPLGGKHALRADKPADLHRLVRDVGNQLSMSPHPPDSYQTDLDAILELANAETTASTLRSVQRTTFNETATPRPQVISAGIVAIGGDGGHGIVGQGGQGGGDGIKIEGGVVSVGCENARRVDLDEELDSRADLILRKLLDATAETLTLDQLRAAIEPVSDAAFKLLLHSLSRRDFIHQDDPTRHRSWQPSGRPPLFDHPYSNPIPERPTVSLLSAGKDYLMRRSKP